MERLFQHNEET